MSTTSQQQLLQSLSDVSKDDIDRMIRVLKYLKSGFRGSPRPAKRQRPDPLLDLESSTMETGIPDLAEQHDAYLYGNKP